MQAGRSRWLALAMMLAGVGCGNDRACVPGTSIACTATSGCIGAQACNSAGSGFEPCVCGGSDGGRADAGSELDAPVLDAPRPDAPALDAPGLDGWALDAPIVCTATALVEPAASIALVLDRSASMSRASKWSTVQLAVVSALDRAAVDGSFVGLLDYPSSFVGCTPCFAAWSGTDVATCTTLVAPGFACGASSLPTVAIGDVDTRRSSAADGVRHDIYQWLVAHSPISSGHDGSPAYEALAAALTAVRARPDDRARGLVWITDGSPSCTSYSLPSRPGLADGACNDWESPASLELLVQAASGEGIETEVIGLPGSNSAGENDGTFGQTAPYHMLLLLSVLAAAGDEDVPPACDRSAVFSMSGADPAAPCHADLSPGASFNADRLAAEIDRARRRILDCRLVLPAGETPSSLSIDLGSVTLAVPPRAVGCPATGCFDVEDGAVVLRNEACARYLAADAPVVSTVCSP